MNRTITRSLLIALGASMINFTPHLDGMTKQAKKMQATAQAMADKAQEKTQQMQQQMKRMEMEMKSQAYQAEYPLHVATRKGDFQKIQQLIAAGADVNKKDQSGRIPLLVTKTPEIILYLLNHGANPNTESAQGPLFPYLIFYHAYDYQYVTPEVVSLFIAKGVDVNASSDNQDTLLMAAACYNRTDIVKLLLQAGAHINAKNSNGKTALDQLNFFEIRDPDINFTETKKLLIDAGAKKAADLP